ncbi:DUF2169 family type VI secretion system accessory protein [Chondromyces crocatus]|uniref:DUF2169 domain-containing protein n=1 Tax=Chondromyces crocatus TaxID=52 RepID=A0A0K1E6M5_CHOCO|nr:DUF2169 domain-containing protein [Chondromyces crocatus]AKT36337.1 uncharacterized protein CMC5_004510 [Chondromyces crocatus]
MWRLTNRTPYAAERCFARDEHGGEVWIVAVKGTFAIREGGRVEVAEHQDAVALTADYVGERGLSSLRCDADLVLTKPGTDVLVHGSAHAPGGVPAARVEVGLRCGPIEKRLVVFGDRVYRPGGVAMSDAQPFVTMPLRYERTFGGVDPVTGVRDPRNPIGVGFAEQAARLAGRPAPNIEAAPTSPRAAEEKRPAPTGVGALARDWSPRIAHAGTYDEAWEERRMPLLPLDFDARFFFSAPVDQQVPGGLREGTQVELLNMTPEGVLAFHLPKRRPCFRTFFGRHTVEHRARLHTVLVEPDARRVMVVWHTALPCQGKEHHLDRTLIWEKAHV